MEAMARARALRAAAAASCPSQAEEAARIDATHARAKERGKVEKTAGESGAAGNLKRKWERWLASPHGEAVADRLKSSGGAPTVEDVKRFSTYTYEHRDRYSCVGRKGGGDSYGELQIPYMLGKFVFPLMGYEGWTGLSLAEAKAKNSPLCQELRDHWKALKVDDEAPTGHDLEKKKWDDQLYFLAQARNIVAHVAAIRCNALILCTHFVHRTCASLTSCAAIVLCIGCR